LITLGSNIQKGENNSPDTYTMKENQYTYSDGDRCVIYQKNPEKYVVFNLQIKLRSPGDGTVCYQSGEDVRAENRKLIQTFIINGYEHSASYANKDVQLNTIYCIANLIDILIKDSELGECNE